MAFAFKLTRENIPSIADHSGRAESKWKEDMLESKEIRFIAFEVTLDGHFHNWINMSETEFFETFDFIDPTRSNKICLA